MKAKHKNIIIGCVCGSVFIPLACYIATLEVPDVFSKSLEWGFGRIFIVLLTVYGGLMGSMYPIKDVE